MMSPALRATCKASLQVADENHGAGSIRLSARHCKRPVVARFATTALLEPLQKMQRLAEAATVKQSLTVQPEGKREVPRSVKLHNRHLLDALTAKSYLRAEKKGSGDAS